MARVGECAARSVWRVPSPNFLAEMIDIDAAATTNDTPVSGSICGYILSDVIINAR